jgi:hypothetical protein
MDMQMPHFVCIFPPHGRDIQQQLSTLGALGACLCRYLSASEGQAGGRQVLAREKLVPLAEQQRREEQREAEQEERCKETQEPNNTGYSRIG